jgi:hypothetical protein
MDPGLDEAFPDGHAYAAITMAFDAWRGLPRVPDLMLVSGVPEKPGHHGNQPTNGIYLVQDWQSEPDQLAITVVTYSKNTGRVLDADILVNGNADIRLLDEAEELQASDYDLGAILAHEAGHSLGLDESEADPKATMWPRVSPGEMHQRTISEDDEEGVIANYAGRIPEAVAGCGQASVLGRPARNRSTLLGALAVLALALLASRSLARRFAFERRTLAFGLGAALIAAPGTGEAPAAERDAQQLRVAVQSEGDAPARARVARAFGPTASLRSLARGHARKVGATFQDGVIMTEHAVRDSEGREHALKVPGGEVGDIVQHWNHTAAGPADGAEVVIETGATKDAAARWAYYRDGLVYGGSLGHGPAIRVAR